MRTASIRKLDWDSALFGRNIGVLEFDGAAPACDVDGGVAQARTQGYHYILCRPSLDDTSLVRALAEARFYLSDQGVTWAADVTAWRAAHPRSADESIVPATDADVPALQDLCRLMFTDSRFYHDPFYSTDEAERLHQEWIKNSVAGQAADAVLWAPRAGFVTLKGRGSAGEIVLIGVEKTQQRRGLGSRLLSAAMAWFAGQELASATVRTQLRNLRASNFYLAHGFTLGGADMTFSLTL